MSRFAFNREHVAAQLALRSWPFPHGKGRITDRFFSKLSFARETETVITTDGFKITVQPSDHIGRHIYLTGEFDRSTFATLARFARPGDMLLDIGSNIGYVTACFLHNVPHSSAVAVEPQPECINLLCSNLQQFLHRFSVVQAAVSDRDGEARLKISQGNKGASALAVDGDIIVRTISGRRLIAEMTRPPDLIKIDVEGHEEIILSSLLPELARHRPRAIVYEDHSDKSAPSNAIGRQFAEFGYHVFAIKKLLTGIRLRPVRSPSDCATNDYVAVA